MQFALLKSLSPQNALMQFRQGKISRFDYALFCYLLRPASVQLFTGKDIIDLRKSLHLTQEALGDILHVTKRTVLRWENESDPVPSSVNIALNALLKLEQHFFDLMKPDCPPVKLIARMNTESPTQDAPDNNVTTSRSPSPLPANFDAEAVCELRERLGMTRREFAAFLDISTSTVDKWETGSVKPKGPALTLLKILWRDGVGIMPD